MYFLSILFNFLLSHLYPLIVFLINLGLLIVFHFKKKYRIRNYIGFFLFILWPGCFYFYLHCFVYAVVSSDMMLLQTYESPYLIKMSLESFSFWMLRFSAVSMVQLPILGFELNSIYFKQFLLETYYCLAFLCEVTMLNFSLKIW